MNVGGWLLWGFVGTIILTLLISGGQELRLTRVNLPYLLGTMFTADRGRAKIYGVLLHLTNGWLFSLAYVAAFESWNRADVLFGMLVGFVHASFVLVVAMPVLPGLHPRMASEYSGPTAQRQLEPPGRLALHYGKGTPMTVMLAHLAYGAVLGAFYRLA